ncbi:L,D-transpeptidase [Tropicibacter oceani]|uniref:L,D-transpeptidase n=1 Tax=Tropicibacter oceani TaxID=3058420 RepID=A0ABY8QNN1_9RHOB|nr:L,D-transpeptidase [Tropicibacter oceani]WGW05427.1 L,D-transpeptidase [Tropicibacter oceani]
MTRLLFFLLLMAGQVSAEALRITVDLSDQQMTVSTGVDVLHVWPVSTARAGKFTPVGSFTPYLMKRMHYSTLYDYAPMPWTIFFTGNFAIHGTTHVDQLGTPASAGCVRLAPENAQALYEQVKSVGMSETRVVIKP